MLSDNKSETVNGMHKTGAVDQNGFQPICVIGNSQGACFLIHDPCWRRRQVRIGRALSRDPRDCVVVGYRRRATLPACSGTVRGQRGSEIRWRQLVLVHNTPVSKVRGGDHRTTKIIMRCRSTRTTSDATQSIQFDAEDRIKRMTDRTVIFLLVSTAVLLVIIPDDCEAQARSTRDVTTAYGARLTTPDVTATVNQNRVNNRISNRLSLRVERYRIDSISNPTATFRSRQDDGVRIPTITTPESQTDANY